MFQEGIDLTEACNALLFVASEFDIHKRNSVWIRTHLAYNDKISDLDSLSITIPFRA